MDRIVEVNLPPEYDNAFLLDVVQTFDDMKYQVKFVPAPKMIQIPPINDAKPYPINPVKYPGTSAPQTYPYVTYITPVNNTVNSNATTESVSDLKKRLASYKEEQM